MYTPARCSYQTTVKVVFIAPTPEYRRSLLTWLVIMRETKTRRLFSYTILQFFLVNTKRIDPKLMENQPLYSGNM